MKYIITESKLESAIIDILDEMFPIEDVNYYHPYDYDDETGEEGDDENRLEFYIGDYEDGETIKVLVDELLYLYSTGISEKIKLQG